MNNGASLFKPAENQQAFLKCGIMGFAGSGKTYTGALIAKGIVEKIKSKKPVYFVDTETGSDFLVPFFKSAGIKLFVSKSRAFVDLLASVQEAEREASVLIIDSISHFWKELQDAHKKATGRNRILFQDWAVLKGTWGRFTDSYLNSRVHIIMNGRAGYEYDYFEDESGAKQLEKTGTKMKAETDMGYEPSLLLEMLREKKDNEDGKVEARLWNHTAYVLKDRTTLLEGKKFVNPTFKDFEPVFDFLNIGGEHIGVDLEKTSAVLFERDSDQNYFEQKKQREIILEDIQMELVSAYPGQSADEKKIKTDLIFDAFNTRSWTALADFEARKLSDGLKSIREQIKKRKIIEVKIEIPKEEKNKKSKQEEK